MRLEEFWQFFQLSTEDGKKSEMKEWMGFRMVYRGPWELFCLTLFNQTKGDELLQ